MVSQKVITPATFTPWVDGARNLILDPDFTSSALWPAAPNGSAAQVAGGRGLAVAVGSSTRNGFVHTLGGTKDAGVYTLGINLEPLISRLSGFRVYLFDSAGGAIRATGVISGLTLSDSRYTVTMTATGVFNRIYLEFTGAGVIAGDAGWMSKPQLNTGADASDFVSGNTPNTLTRMTYFDGAVNASESVRSSRVQLTTEVTAPVYETVTLASEVDSITFYATPDAGGWVYDNNSLQRWYEIADTDVKIEKRPNAHGAYSLGQIFTKEHRPALAGKYYGTSSSDAKAQRRRLAAMFNDGLPITMTVVDEDGASTVRQVWLVDYEAPFDYDFSFFEFDLDLVAPDPRRYGPTSSSSDDMPTSGGGLFWDLGTAPSDLFFDWGEAGIAGQVTFTNTGLSSTFPRIEVGGGGSIGNGFRVTEIETGRELTYSRTLTSGQTVVLDSRTQRATFSTGGDVTAFLTSRRWFEIPRGQTRRYQITPLGAVTGSPKITIYAASAEL